MSQKEFMKYLETPEFKEILERYETSLDSGELGFFDADDLIDIAEYFHLDGNIPQADHTIRLCLERYPDDSGALLFAARLELLYFNNIKRARELYNEVQDKDDNPDADYVYAEILVIEGKAEEADRFLKRKYKYYQEQEPDRDDFEEEDDDLNFPLDMAVLFIDHNYADLAEEWIMRATAETEDEMLDMWETKARIYMQQGRMKEAETAWNKLLDGDAYHYTAWMRLCDTQFALGKFDEAIQSSEYAIAISPDQAEAYLSNGNGHFQLNNLPEAAKSLNKYLELCPDDPAAHLLLSTTYYCLNNAEAAYDHILNALANKQELTETGKMDAYHLAACIAAKLEMADEAWGYCEEYKKAGAPKSDVEILYGIICLESYNDEEAKRHFLAALQNANGDLGYITKVGLTLYDYAAWDAVYELLVHIPEAIDEEKHAYLPKDLFPLLAATSRQLGRQEDFLAYLKDAVRYAPYESVRLLAEFFPPGAKAEDYVRLATGNDKPF